MATADMLELGKPYPLQLQLEHDDFGLNEQTAVEWVEYEVRSGDSLAVIFNRLGFSAQQLYQITQIEHESALRRIHPGNKIQFAKQGDNEILELHFALDEKDTIVIRRNDEGLYESTQESKIVESRIEFAQATITSNFWNAGVEAGLTQNQIMNLADLFGWDVDFALDIRTGDRFSVLFEQNYVDGHFIGNGRIVAAEFINQNETFRAVLHENGNYYTPEGKNMRKSFLRAPVHFTRVSSSFNPRRMHPVTGRVSPHNGIDYAAATGTPVMSAGDGRVLESGYNNLNGHYIFVQHGERYVTKYLHLSRRHVSRGERVRQGQVIGRVGATGRVTGAHLHYEFLVDGVHRNPRTVTLPQAESLPSDMLPAFTSHAQQQMASLENRKRVFLALNTL